MQEQEVIMGTLDPGYKMGKARMITFCVTEECNLRCKYCYMTDKNTFNRMSFDIAIMAVDFFLSQPPEEETVIWDFIGGEPTLEMELIDKISDYIKQQMFFLDHPWFNDYVFNIGSNGLLYRSTPVQNYLSKNAGHVAIAITIDGTKEKHDLMRIKPNGSGSYDEVLESVRLWQQQYPGASTKVTFSSDDLKYLKDSIIHLWNIGLDRIPANVVFEDVWKEGDDILFEEQLRSLADYIIENRLYFSKSVRFFDPSVGFPMGKKHKQTSFCGTGKMVAVDPSGNLFPCVRFLDFCIPNKPPLMTGSIFDGYYEMRRNAFNDLTVELLNDGECENCSVASGCFSCTGCNYSYAKGNTIFKRTKFHCAMQKAQVRANEYFSTRFIEVEDRISPHELKRKDYYESEGWAPDGAKYLYFIVDEACTPICHYRGGQRGDMMSKETLDKGLRYAGEQSMVPVFIGNPYAYLNRVAKKKLHIVISDQFDQELLENPICVLIPVYNDLNIYSPIVSSSCILPVSRKQLDHLAEVIERIGDYSQRINLKIVDASLWGQTDIELYCSQLSKLSVNIRRKLNIFAHLIKRENGCKAGVTEFALAPNGKLYPCPGYYYECPNEVICDVNEIECLQSIDSTLYDHSKSPQCKSCKSLNCEQCTLQNLLASGFTNLPSSAFCSITNAVEIADVYC